LLQRKHGDIHRDNRILLSSFGHWHAICDRTIEETRGSLSKSPKST
jgi:hypothetical protein